MNNPITSNNFHQICRSCLKFKENMYVISENEIIFMIEECTSVHEAMDKKFPDHICEICYTQLKNAYEFKRQYLLSIKFLNDLLLDEEKNFKNSVHSSDMFKEELDIDFKYEMPDNYDVSSDIDIKEEEEAENDVNKDDCTFPKDTKLRNSCKDKKVIENGEKRRKIGRKSKLIKTKHQKKNLRAHKLSHGKIKSYGCKFCSSRFKYPFTLTSHVQITHGQKIDINSEIDQSGNKEDEPPTIPTSPDKNSDDETPIKRTKPIKKRRHRQQSIKTDCICDICGKKFQHRKNLRVHKVSHSSLKPYECSVCNRTFKYSFTLTSHIKIKHTQPERREICFVCGKSVVPNSLSYHLSTHSVEKQKFKCDICEKEYCQKSALRQHYEEKHTDVANQKFYCDICNKGYETRRTLQTHKLYIHNTSRKFTCHICEKNFSCPSSVRKHINAQHKDLRPHGCDVCAKAFHTKTLLDKHRVTHTGERPYSCTICGKSFGFKSVLSTHMKVHNK